MISITQQKLGFFELVRKVSPYANARVDSAKLVAKFEGLRFCDYATRDGFDFAFSISPLSNTMNSSPPIRATKSMVRICYRIVMAAWSLG